MAIRPHRPNHEHRVLSSAHPAVEGIVILTILGRPAGRGAHPGAEVGARHRSGKSQDHPVHPGAGVEARHPNGKSQDRRVHPGAEVGVPRRSERKGGRHVVRRKERSLQLPLRQNVEVGPLARERGMMWVSGLVDGRVMVSRRREGHLGKSGVKFMLELANWVEGVDQGQLMMGNQEMRSKLAKSHHVENAERLDDAFASPSPVCIVWNNIYKPLRSTK